MQQEDHQSKKEHPDDVQESASSCEVSTGDDEAVFRVSTVERYIAKRGDVTKKQNKKCDQIKLSPERQPPCTVALALDAGEIPHTGHQEKQKEHPKGCTGISSKMNICTLSA